MKPTRRLQAFTERWGDRAPDLVAALHGFRGEADAAFQWLERTSGNDPFFPLFAPLRDDPRWLPFLERVGKSPEQLAAIEFEVKLPRSSR